MATAHCPTCGKRFDIQGADYAPFCSQRCQQIDLKRWMNEEYSVPVEELEEEELDRLESEELDQDADR